MDASSQDSGLNTPPKATHASNVVDEKGQDVRQMESGVAPPIVDAETERRIIRKLDYRIIPMICWVYLMNFMDRVNIGNARLYGMEDELGLRGNQFQISVSILFVTYCLFETPSNMIIKRLQPARYLTGLTLCWGLVATFSAFVNNFAALVACRLLLGIFEAGFFPGVILYLSMFYNRRSVALRNAYFYGTSAISGALGGLVAYGIGELDGAAGWQGWRWIILINGLPTIVTAIFIPFVLPNSPETASFLTEEDRRNLVIIRQAEVGQTASGQHLHKADVMAGVKDWKVYAFAICQFIGLSMLYSFSVFLPTIINGLGGGWSSQQVQALTIPVYFSGAGMYLFTAWYSDKIQVRGYFCIGGLLVSMIGYIFLIANQSMGMSFAGCFIIALGLWTATGAAFTWVSVNNPRYGKRAFASGMQLTIGNSSGVAAPFLFSSGDAPEYRPGYGATIGMLAVGATIYTILHFWFRNANKRKAEGKEDWRIQGLTEEEAKELGDLNPAYRYTI